MKSEPQKLSSLTQTPAMELIAAGKALGTPQIPADKRLQPYLIVPQGYEVQPIGFQPLEPLHDHIRQRVRLDDADSFVAYVKGFRTHTTRIFAEAPDLDAIKSDGSGVEFTALLDYHEGGTGQQPKRVAHVAEYPVLCSHQFKVWMKLNGQPQSQMDFVRFIEDNAGDVVSPDSASLMEMALNFEARSTVNFQSRVDRVTGGRQLTYQEEVNASGGGNPTVGQLKVPERLELRLPLFQGGKPYQLLARLEYRPNSGRLNITYHLQRPHELFEKALKEMREEIASQLEAEILTGTAIL